MSNHKVLATLLWLVVGLAPVGAADPPDYTQSVLEYVYPAGGQRGQTVQVRFGTPSGKADSVVIDGPAGITVRDIQPGKNVVTATFDIAKDAPVGRRMVRLAGGPYGLTNFRWFVVGRQREYIEEERNDTPKTANEVTTPIVVNGRVQKAVDIDCYRFRGTKGQTVVAAVNAHGLDAMGYGRDDSGFVDTSLELLDETGRVLASAQDTIGFDPALEYTLPTDGWYMARVSGLGYRGFPQAVYRLTLGDVGYVTSVYPAGGRRGSKVALRLAGLNLPADTQWSLDVGKAAHPVEYVTPDDDRLVGHDLAFVRSDLPESIETEPNDDQARAEPLPFDSVVNGRFATENDEDWFKLDLAKGERIELEITAQQHLRSPVDTLLEVFDSTGKRIAGNDDGAIFDGMTTHDFRTFDSRLEFVAKKAGPHFVRITEQTGSFGPLAVYRLTCRRGRADFRLYQWPDAVPIWGPGSSSTFAVDVIRTGSLKADIEITVEGLPEGWKGSTTVSPNAGYFGPRLWNLGTKVLLTITAPADAKIGDMVPFRVVGRARQAERTIEQKAQPLTLYMWGNHRLRVSPTARAVVAPPRAMQLRTDVHRIEAEPGQTIEVPVTVEMPGEKPEPFSLIANGGKSHVKCNLGSPIKFAAGNTSVTVPVAIAANAPVGSLDIVIAQQWRSDIRTGLPGPCTRLIRIDVGAKRDQRKSTSD